MTNTLVPIGRKNEIILVEAISAIHELVGEAIESLRGVNDAPLRKQIETLVNVTDLVVSNHAPLPKPTIADDLNGLMKGWIAFRPPNSDPDLGRTPTLSAVRQTKGLMLAGINDALEAAEGVGLRARQPALMPAIVAEVPKASISSLLDSIHARLIEVEKTLDALDAAREQPTSFRQQQGLLNFYVGSMRVEASLTKLHLGNITEVLDLDGIVRAIEVMSELTHDFIETVRSWGKLLANNVISTAERVTKQISRLVRGVRATSFALVRIVNRKKVDQVEDKVASKRIEEDFASAEELDEPLEDFVGEQYEAPPAIYETVAYLRRYARALTGHQEDADDLLDATLRGAVGFENSHRDWSKRVELFTVFSQIVAKFPLLGASSRGRDRIYNKLGQIPFNLRQIFLLSAMEGFSDQEIAFILSKPISEVVEAQTRLELELAEIVATRVLIIEDDPFQAHVLEELFVSLGHTVVGIARSADEAVRLANEHSPGLISVDIQLASGSGLTAAHAIVKSISAVFIFITAYPERFLTGGRPEPAFLISKPFQPAMVAAVASQGLFFSRTSQPKAR
jgi:CheY-like chemotaxis protein